MERLRNLERAADAEPATPLGRQASHIAARQHDATRIGSHRAARDAEQRTLAGPIRSDDAERFAFRDREVKPLRHDHCTEALGYLLEREDGSHSLRQQRKLAA